MGFRGIKNRVFIHFWILFFLSMLLIDVLVVFFFLEKTISQLVQQKQFSLIVACENQLRPHRFDLALEKPIDQGVFTNAEPFFFVNRPGAAKGGDQPDFPVDTLEAAVYQTLNTGQAIERNAGKTFGFFFFQPEWVMITYPVKAESSTIAAGGVKISLTGIYQDFRRIQKLAFIFVVINSFLFALFGNQQLSRIYFRPLKRLAKRAETYQDEDTLFFSVRKEDNDFFALSSSLNKMLHRISDDKRVLNKTIGSLKAANTELKKAQKDLIRAEKLATVGRLTSGIAHEVGNPIGIVLGYLDLLKQTDLTPAERDDFITRSEKEIARINHIIRQLLDMSRTSGGDAKPVSIHQLLEELNSVFDFQPAANQITFDSHLNAADDIVFADPDQLRQVFLNILLNAVDALNTHCSEDGRITMTTQCFTHVPAVPIDPDGPFIKVTIKDNGPGIDPLDLPHIFDPFFTTKSPGKGTGLGLSVSFMIVEKLGGHLYASSNQGKGTAFHVVLPLIDHEDKNKMLGVKAP
jgi:signal transduction histidine kinase